MTPSPADAICQFVPPFMRFLRDGLAEVNMSPARFQILQALKQGGALSMVEVAERLSVTKRNITTLVDGLEGDGLAARRPHPTDRRSTLVELTPAGDAVFVRAAKVQREHLEELMANLDTDQQQDMARALTHLTKHLMAKQRGQRGLTE
ncbi:MAG: MarR family transcriptional regulator [Cyanobacteria bacterium J06639_1]